MTAFLFMLVGIGCMKRSAFITLAVPYTGI
jgi:hypothetical protein